MARQFAGVCSVRRARGEAVSRPRKHVVIEPGMTFGKLVVVEKAEPLGKQLRWICQCSCGRTTAPLETNLQRGSTRSCGQVGCIQYRPRKPCPIEQCSRRPGDRSGALVIVQRDPRHQRTQWICRCDCGVLLSMLAVDFRGARSCGDASKHRTARRTPVEIVNETLLEAR